MKQEQTVEQKIQTAVSEVHDNMLAYIKANRAIVVVTLEKEKVRYALQESKKRLAALEKELLEL